MPFLTLSVNGIEHQLDADPQMPLLWALRDRLKLTGTKYSCGIGQCGACMVLLDGQAVPSCTLPLAQAAGHSIRTIEGLAGDRLHPLQEAWIELQVPQCGFCHSGQLIAASALLQHSPIPTDEEIDAAMSPVLCRCGTYCRIRAAIHLAAKRLAEG